MNQAKVVRPTHWARSHQLSPVGHADTQTANLKLHTGGLAKTKLRLKPKVRYAVIVMLGIVAIMASQLIISVFLAQGAYEINSLQRDLKESSRTAESIGEDIALLTSPQYLAANATELGMVPTRDVTFLRLSDGKVMGSLTVAGSRGPIANPKVQNQLLNQESQYLAGILGTTATIIEGETTSDSSTDSVGGSSMTTLSGTGFSEVVVGGTVSAETPNELTPVDTNAPIVSNEDSRGLSPIN